MAAAPAPGTRGRVVIDAIHPIIDGGKVATKHIVGEPFHVRADLVLDGHDVAAGVLLFRREGESDFAEVALAPDGVDGVAGTDRYHAAFTPDLTGRWEYAVEGWVDEFASWRRGFARKLEAGEVGQVDFDDGVALIRAAAERTNSRELRSALNPLSASTPLAGRARLILDDALAARCARHADRRLATRSDVLPLVVDPLRARFSSWYEMFPRSTGADGQHGTFATATARLEHIAKLGFDIVYLPPIHPIGRAFRKGKNNNPVAEPDDVGSPWAIGAAEGGHDAIHPALGSVEDFAAFVARANVLGLEVAIDLAFQASPDHPWVGAHPEWFIHRADGSILSAENPPKKYQDVYPFNLAGEGATPLWQALLEVVEVWIARGVTVFRVDNPHTKPLPFWAWLIDGVKRRHPDIVFLAEAFTRPTLMYALAKLGFSQSYTYFTWRTTKDELTAYMTELCTPPVADFFRLNLWPSTPDILPEHLQEGGRAAFIARAVLAATLSASWGVYGPAFELGEHVARPGSEDYADSEKYQLRTWNLDDPASIAPVLGRLNRIRREHRALHANRSLHFHPTDNDHLLAYSKVHGDDAILVVVNLDPHHRHSGWVELDLPALGQTSDTQTLQAHDLLSEARYSWRGQRAFIELDPAVFPAHVFVLRRFTRRERDFEYFA